MITERETRPTDADAESRRQHVAIVALTGRYNRQLPTAYSAQQLAYRLQEHRRTIIELRRDASGELPNLFGDASLTRLDQVIERTWRRRDRRYKTERSLPSFEAWVLDLADHGAAAVPSLFVQAFAIKLGRAPKAAPGMSGGLTAGELLDLANRLGQVVTVAGGSCYAPEVLQ